MIPAIGAVMATASRITKLAMDSVCLILSIAMAIFVLNAVAIVIAALVNPA